MSVALSLIPRSLKPRLKRFRARAIHIATSPYRAFKFICFCVGFAVIAMTLCIGLYARHFMNSLPDFAHLDYSQARRLAVHRVSERIEHKRPVAPWVDLDHVSRDLLYAIVMSEDATFFDHSGIDYEAILSSLSQNLKHKKYEYGASTISQQVVKNLFLTDEKSLSRKLKEIASTLKMERHYSKNQILELYLNVAEFGPDLFGVEEASRHYFKKSPAQMNAAEGAFLALMLPSPRKFHYAVFENQNITKAKKKKIKRILADMLANEYISPRQYKEYLKYDYFQEPSGGGSGRSPRAPASRR